MRHILVTGGAGFIGSNFVRYWLNQYPQDRVINLDALTYAGNAENLAGVEALPNYRFVHGDICDADLVASIFKEESVDTVAHFAAESHVDRSISGPAEFIRTNIQGTFTLLECARAAWSDTAGRCFLHVSTDEVYGSLAPGDAPFDEDHQYAPNSPYSASKASSDHLVRAYHETYGLPVVTSNCSNNYGPFQFPEKLIPLVILNALSKQAIPVYGDGAQIRDWLYVADHCQALDAVLTRGKVGSVYNIGGCNEWRNIDIVNLICDRLNQVRPAKSDYRELISFVKDRPGHDRRYAINAGRIQTELDWKPEHDFESGIVATIDWYLEHQDWCDRVRSGEYQTYYQRQYG